MLVATSTQVSVNFLPISGTSASRGGGGGKVRLWFCKPEMSEYMESRATSPR